MKLLITGGGTGGHVSPGLAVAGVWRGRHGADSVVWAGRKGGIEERMAAGAGIRFEGVVSAGLRRSMDWRNLVLPVTLGRGLAQAFQLLKRERPDAVLMTGGYAGAPVAMAAALKQDALVLLEPNAVLGLANRFFSGAAAALCLAYPLAPARPNGVVTGNPVRFGQALPGRAGALKQFGLGPVDGSPVLLVIPGSQGAGSINRALGSALAGLKRSVDPRIIWVTGPKDLEDAKRASAAAGIRAFVAPFIDDVGAAYAASDLVLARSGASMLAEIAMAGKPSLLVPFPFAAADHQSLNARSFAAAGASRVVEDHDLDLPQGAKVLEAELNSLFANAPLLKRMASAAQGLGKPDAAEAVTGVLERVIKGFRYV